MTQITRRGQRHNGFRLCVEIVAERASIEAYGADRELYEVEMRIKELLRNVDSK